MAKGNYKKKNSSSSQPVGQTKTQRRINAKARLMKMKIYAFLAITLILGLSFLFTPQIEALLNFETNSGGVSTDISTVTDNKLNVHYIDVGQGDCILIELPDGKKVMIDTGPSDASIKLNNYLNNMIFESSAEKVIDYLVLTHSDADHIGCALSVINNYDVLNVFRPNVYSEQETAPAGAFVDENNAEWVRVVNAINAEVENPSNVFFHNIEAQSSTNTIEKATGTVLEKYSIKFYTPLKVYENANDYSPIMVLSYNSKKFMFTGDASGKKNGTAYQNVEKDFLDTYATEIAGGQLDIDVLKVGHHGSKYSSSTNFLNAITPKYAVFCVGKNSYGHPADEVVAALRDMDAEILRTDINGSIMMYVNSNGEINSIVGFYMPNSYYIEWWYVAISIELIVFVTLFIRKNHRV